MFNFFKLVSISIIILWKQLLSNMVCVCVCVCVCAECGGVPGELVVTDVIPASQLGQPREKKHTLPKHVQLTLGRCSTSTCNLRMMCSI